MAKITTATNERVYQIKKWLGLNENPDGDTGLKFGEASVMRNFRITRENHLQVRAGYAQRFQLGSGPVRCLWDGYVSGAHVFLAVCGNHLWRIDGEAPVDCGEVAGDSASIFGFAKKAYVLTGSEYYCWDGARLAVVDGYIPVVAVATPPAGGGTLLEAVNKLTGKRRQKFSPDGNAKVFQLAEKDLAAIDSVEINGSAATGWTGDPKAGTVTFATAPAKAVNNLTVTYDKGEADRSAVTAMRYAELFNGATDNRVFLYGDGSNRTIYSDLDDDGQPTAEYFPDLNVLDAGSANTPVTGMIRHFSRLLVFKLDGAYSVTSSTVTLADESTTSAFYLTPVQREVGNAAMGQVRLVYNNPRTLHGGAVYDWKGSYTYITSDERVVKRVSQRVEETLQSFDLAACVTWDDEETQEYYICWSGQALVHNYGNDTWYFYDNFPVQCMERFEGELYFGTPTGELMHFARQYRSDNGVELAAYWESGAMDFEMDWKRKYSSDLWVSIEPESQARVNLAMKSNRRGDYPEKVIFSNLATFFPVNFAHFSFLTNREPQVKRARIKIKKFVYSTLMFSSVSRSSTVTILGVDFKVRYTGNVK